MNNIETSSHEKIGEVRPRVTYESLTFSDGTTVTLDPNDIVVFVGPNNAGKSAALKEIENYLGKNADRSVITSVKLRKEGSVSEIRSFLQHHSIEKRDLNLTYSGYRFSVPDQHISHFWGKTSLN